LERKAPRHLEDFGICTEGKTREEMALEYKDLLENLFSKPNLVIREDGTLNQQEPTINIGDPESLGIPSFSNNFQRIRSRKTIILLVVLPFRKKHLKRFKKQVILVVVQKKERKKSMNYKELKRKQKEKEKLHARFIGVYRRRPALGISNCVKLKLFKSG
jgi:hypothetical protein